MAELYTPCAYLKGSFCRKHKANVEVAYWYCWKWHDIVRWKYEKKQMKGKLPTCYTQSELDEILFGANWSLKERR